jgi:muramidase (phage lysozyme)
MDPRARKLLDFIYLTEVKRTRPGCYEVIFGNRQTALEKPLTRMTVAQVQQAQRTWSTKAWAKRFGSSKASSAAGAAQFMRATLGGLLKAGYCRADELFDGECQDRLALRLLERRGWTRFIAGRMSRAAFALELAKEWASFPVLTATAGAHRQLKRGQSFYAGDGLNKALVSPEAVEAVLAGLKGSPLPDTAGEPEGPLAPAPGGVADELPPEEENDAAPEEEADGKPLSRSTRFWTWLTTGGGTAMIPFVDWRVQILIVALVGGLAIYAIATMPAFRKKLGLS